MISTTRLNSIVAIMLFSIGIRNVSAQKLRELKIGDRMPDISLGKTINNQAGVKRFSDFKGKLVILDFWAKTCKPCIEGFPRMEELQKKYGDKIQILLVTNDTEKEILETFAMPFMKKYPLPQLPCIVSDTVLRKFFPHSSAGHTVWIDSKGIVRLKGIPNNNSEEKINEILEGKKIVFLRDDTWYSRKKPFYTTIDSQKELKIETATFFSRFSDQGNSYGETYENIIDSASQTNRTTILNMNILHYYQLAYRHDLTKDWYKVLSVSGRGTKYDKQILLNVKDSSRYSWYYLPENQFDDKWMRNNLFCYEQVLPLSDAPRARTYMQQDINRFFGGLYGTEGRIEKRKIKCFLLIRTSQEDKLKTKSETYTDEVVVKEGQEFRSITKSKFRSIMQSMVWGLFPEIMLIDETGYTGEIDITYPTDIKNIDELKKRLNKYNLDIIEGDKELPFLVITEREHKESFF